MKTNPLILSVLSLASTTLACGLFKPRLPEIPAPVEVSTKLPAPTPVSIIAKATPKEPASGMPTLAPATDTNGNGKVDICEAIPQATLEEAIGRKLTGPGQPFQDASMGDGCSYDFGKDGNEAYFAYITFATEQQFNDALASAVQPEPVTALGDSAFLSYGPDARQLWARAGNKAVLVGIGDRENIPAALILARYLIAAL